MLIANVCRKRRRQKYAALHLSEPIYTLSPDTRGIERSIGQRDTQSCRDVTTGDHP